MNKFSKLFATLLICMGINAYGATETINHQVDYRVMPTYYGVPLADTNFNSTIVSNQIATKVSTNTTVTINGVTQQLSSNVNFNVSAINEVSSNSFINVSNRVVTLEGQTNNYAPKSITNDLNAISSNLIVEIDRATNAEYALDVKIGTTSNYFYNIVTNLDGSILINSNLTYTYYTNLLDLINIETNRAYVAETNLQGQITSGTNRIQNLESQTNTYSNTNDLYTVNTNLIELINNETNRAFVAETNLQYQINNETNRAIIVEEGLTNAITNVSYRVSVLEGDTNYSYTVVLSNGTVVVTTNNNVIESFLNLTNVPVGGVTNAIAVTNDLGYVTNNNGMIEIGTNFVQGSSGGITNGQSGVVLGLVTNNAVSIFTTNLTVSGNTTLNMATTINGANDAVQLSIKANATQNSNVVEVLNSNGVSRVYIDKLGNVSILGKVGIGTAPGTEPLLVSGNVQASKFLDYSDSQYYLDPAITTTSLVIAGTAVIRSNIVAGGSITMNGATVLTNITASQIVAAGGTTNAYNDPYMTSSNLLGFVGTTCTITRAYGNALNITPTGTVYFAADSTLTDTNAVVGFTLDLFYNNQTFGFVSSSMTNTATLTSNAWNSIIFWKGRGSSVFVGK